METLFFVGVKQFVCDVYNGIARPQVAVAYIFFDANALLVFCGESMCVNQCCHRSVFSNPDDALVRVSIFFL